MPFAEDLEESGVIPNIALFLVISDISISIYNKAKV